jgi:peptidoglycan/xylan/chitin deacetylase (PgdA/CDA1 family)
MLLGIGGIGGTASFAIPPPPGLVSAQTTRSQWPTPIDSPAAFDTASRGEIALFALALSDDDAQPTTAEPAADLASIESWKSITRQRLLRTFAEASTTCHRGVDVLCLTARPRDWPAWIAALRPAIDALAASFSAWRKEAGAFHTAYLREQLRLAALFPTVTSEILPLDPSELLGDGLPDRTFLLTFDDGPTLPGDTTETTIAALRDSHVNGLFLLLGSAVTPRRAATSDLALRSLYAGMCVGSHGAEHRSHVRWPEALDHLNAFNGELAALLPPGQSSLRFFRPPFGQRSAEIVRSLAAHGVTTVLWNIDSEDWQDGATANLTAGRVLTLMLLKRRGILLFHDVHPVAAATLPSLLHSLEHSGTNWLDCRDLGTGPARRIDRGDRGRSDAEFSARSRSSSTSFLLLPRSGHLDDVLSERRRCRRRDRGGPRRGERSSRQGADLRASSDPLAAAPRIFFSAVTSLFSPTLASEPERSANDREEHSTHDQHLQEPVILCDTGRW